MNIEDQKDRREYYEKMMEEIGTHPDFGKRNPVDIGIECGYPEETVMEMIRFLQDCGDRQKEAQLSASEKTNPVQKDNLVTDDIDELEVPPGKTIEYTEEDYAEIARLMGEDIVRQLKDPNLRLAIDIEYVEDVLEREYCRIHGPENYKRHTISLGTRRDALERLYKMKATAMKREQERLEKDRAWKEKNKQRAGKAR